MGKDNKGFSLVELLVAITISAIVAGGIGYLLTTSLRMYNKDTVDVSLQQELQITLNQIVDYAMESETIVADFDDTYPNYLALGTFESVSGTGVLDKTKLNAQIIWQDGNKLYIKKATIADFCLSADPENAHYREIDKSKIVSLIPSAGTSSDANLLAQYVTAFKVTGIGGIVEVKDESGNVTGHAYENPLSIILELEFKKSVAAANKNKKVKDTAYLRNKVTNDIYVNVSGQSYQYCSLYEKNSVSVETTTVDMEKKAGILQIPGSEHGGVSYDLNILEIVPDYTYDYVQYVLGGENGAILNSANTSYGKSASIKPISPSELEGFFIRSAGGRYNNNSTYGQTSFYPNVKADIPAMYITPAKSRVGYYEYVGVDNGGIYAIDSVTSSMGPATGGAGTGDTKPVIDYFVHDSYGNTTDFTGKYYRPIFEYVGEDEEKTDSWYYTVVSANEVTGGEYDKEILVINHENWTEKKEIYKYVGASLGHYDLTFGWPQTSYGVNNAFYRVSGDINDTFSAENGRYYAHLTGNKWEYRTDTSSYTVGFDYSRRVEDVMMFSKYHNQDPSKSKDYGWIWHEEASGKVHDEIVSGTRFTSASLIDTGGYVNYSSPSEKNRIYLKDHIRNTVINNETFKLFTMQDIFEEYTPNSMLDIRYGIWDTTNEKYCEVNKNALSSWEGSGHKVTLNVRIPTDVTATDIENSDLIIFGVNGDGGFDYAKQLYELIRGSVSAQTNTYSSSNDLSFENVLLIYKKVIAEEVGIACPYTLISAGGNKASTNIGRLFEMLYCVQNEDITKESIVNETVTNAKLKKIKKQGETSNYWTIDPDYQKDMPDRVLVQGSGREMFSDFIKSMANKALSKPLYDDKTLSHPTTDFVYIEESGADAGSIIVPAKNETIEGYVFNNSAKVISEWGGGGGGALSAFEENLLQWNTNKYLCDRYRSSFTGYDKTTFVWNPVYKHFYKFSYSEPQAGIYRNQLVWNQTSDLLHFSKSGGSGLLGIQTIRNNTKNEGAAIPADIIGNINYVGADLEEAAVYRRNNQGDTTVKQYSDMPDYSMKIIDLPDYLADPTKPDTVVTKKVLYLSEEQFKKAQTEGLYLYVLIKSSKDPSSYNKCVLWYEKNEKDAEGKPLKGRVDYVDFDFGTDNKETSENVIKYASGLLPDNNINPAEKYVREYRYHVPAQYFANLAPPYNNKNNMIIARIDKTAEREYEGNDTLYIYIRDTFDLE
ncbi:MAG: prepilin-type N-terminal cleavage/methylation domain-containing protein [Phoenicibacter congonensis]|uniref:Prepilin-type N-terminal cleavage/methylation domain-containing protein n=1 Tax=Phoenicibacter congonensis TaxID=1944646 RepID=A0AA43RIR0_9ACTN|nr:prepilin-type N-terminal cleavage/methylation domain-containing protein [Phoenicibacter congonensis]